MLNTCDQRHGVWFQNVAKQNITVHHLLEIVMSNETFLSICLKPSVLWPTLMGRFAYIKGTINVLAHFISVRYVSKVVAILNSNKVMVQEYSSMLEKGAHNYGKLRTTVRLKPSQIRSAYFFISIIQN